jgi:hypothetical protein
MFLLGACKDINNLNYKAIIIKTKIKKGKNPKEKEYFRNKKLMMNSLEISVCKS